VERKWWTLIAVCTRVFMLFRRDDRRNRPSRKGDRDPRGRHPAAEDRVELMDRPNQVSSSDQAARPRRAAVLGEVAPIRSNASP
jgi:hypothetical protein